ncbi:cofactor-independent phosphoglycerate mutase [Methanolobus halotolerans]|uniref:2,3-bisphosphoglycerate-independent phosphoglycerate mutase n=1 Tax=Methanolobus halotolerans TaxID=2052935 RepID=A0A4E0PY86_9EURY|nr:cofactor-independent phosphoglycerate mutase [Methanolobus halotolerans]TGC11178.1 cofactor-independent phosphoglycerate mutase [Methanolobus halotolerans]
MKYVVLIGDGMADEPLEELGGMTVLQKAMTPNMDHITFNGRAGLARTVPYGLPPGSDVANMSIIGYDPKKYYSGRAPFEAASMRVELEKDDVAFRCNLITIKDDIIADHSSGHITNEEAKELIGSISSALGDDSLSFYPGISYRHLMVTKKGLGANTECVPPHDIIDENRHDHMPKGKDSDIICELTERSMEILKDHPVNKKRIEEGRNPGNSIWLWGQGFAPAFTSFKELYGLRGAIISAVDLVKGIGIYAGLDVIEVPGATGYLDTNYQGKAEYAIEALKDHDFVFVHVEAPDEAGHMGDVQAKIQAIEDFDEKVVGTVLKAAKQYSEDVTIMVLPDHPTPIALRTHTSTPIPFAIYSTSEAFPDASEAFDEESVKKGALGTVYAADLVSILIGP